MVPSQVKGLRRKGDGKGKGQKKDMCTWVEGGRRECEGKGRKNVRVENPIDTVGRLSKSVLPVGGSHG